MSQTTYNFNPAPGVEGMVAEIREGTIIISKVAQGLVPVGKMCQAGTNAEVGANTTAADPQSATPGQVIAWQPGITDNPLLEWEFEGIPIYDSSRAPYDPTNAYLDKDPVPVLLRGPIWVKPETAFTNTKTGVYVRVAASGGFTVLGAFSGVAGPGLSLMPNGISQWLTAVNPSTGLAILEIS